MIKEKAERLFRRFKRNWRSMFLLWFPAGIVVLLLAIVFFSVAFSKDSSFHDCARQLTVCAGENPKLTRMTVCSYQTAWCDIKVIWDKATGKAVIADMPGLPPVDEKADKELFEKLTSDEFLEKRFEAFEEEEKIQSETQRIDDLPEKEDLKEYMEELRAQRIQFEREMAEKREKILEERSSDSSEENNLSGQTEK